MDRQPLRYGNKAVEHLEGLEADIGVIKVNVQSDHIHMIMIIPPRVSVARVVQFMKSRTAKILKDKFSYMGREIWGREGATGTRIKVANLDTAQSVNSTKVLVLVEQIKTEFIPLNYCI